MRSEIPQEYFEHAFPKIPDEFWDRVGDGNKKVTNKKRRTASKSSCFLICYGYFCGRLMF